MSKTHHSHSHYLKMIAASALIMALMTSCASSEASKTSDGFYTERSGSYSMNSKSDSMEESFDDSLELTEEAGEVETAKSGSKTEKDFDDKIIRTADLSIDSSDAQKCYDTLAAFALQNGGREVSVRKSSDTYGNYDYINIDAELKIAPDKLNEFLDLAEKTDKVTNSQISTNDITQEYYDIKLRLETKKEALKSYYKLLKEASTIEEALEVQQYITELTSDIESMEGMLKYYDSKVDLSTVSLHIRQEIRLHVGAKDEFHWDSLTFSDFITLIKNGFLSVVNFLWSLLLWLIIIAAAISPLLLIAAVIIFIIRRYRKKHPRKPKAPKQAQPVNMYIPAYYPPQNGTVTGAPVQTPAPDSNAGTQPKN